MVVSAWHVSSYTSSASKYSLLATDGMISEFTWLWSDVVQLFCSMLSSPLITLISYSGSNMLIIKHSSNNWPSAECEPAAGRTSLSEFQEKSLLLNCSMHWSTLNTDRSVSLLCIPTAPCLPFPTHPAGQGPLPLAGTAAVVTSEFLTALTPSWRKWNKICSRSRK